jgi:3-hydroxyisobutyrate dehydrogenase-like beta-hydroxyacid dehydrogenase
MSERIAFLGLGIMGSRQAANLAKAGFDLTVWNRTVSTAQQFAADHEGVTVAESPAQAAAEADVVFTMVVDGDQVHQVLLGDDGAATRAPDPTHPTLFVDCSTIGPAATREIGEALDARGHSLVDAPVTGSSPKAQDGTLTFMVGATEDQFARLAPALNAMGELIVHAGPRGHGQMIKLLNNAMAAANAAIVGEALVVGSRAGVDLDALVTVAASGAGGSTMLNLKAGPMRDHDYTTLFKLEHMLKDVRLCLEEGQRLGVPFPSAAYVREILNAGMGMGHADDDFAAMIEPLEGAAGERL